MKEVLTPRLARPAAGRAWLSFAVLAIVAAFACVAAVPLHALTLSMPLVGVGLSTLTSNNPTLLDLAKATDPDGAIADVAEILNETNEVLDDMSWVEGNLATGHRTSIRTGIPSPTWRKIYGGVQPTKASTVQVTDTCGMLEAYGQVDKALADLNGNTMAFRASEDRAHIEGMSQQIASTLFYGNETSLPESFTGLAPRFSTLVQATAPSGFNVIDFGGTGAVNTSIWLVVWGPRTVHGIVPKGSKAGLQARDLGEQIIQNSDGSKYQAYISHYRWDAGLTVRDWRYIVRIANVDTSNAGVGVGVLANTPNIVNAMIQALEHIPMLAAGRPVFYMNRCVRQQLRLGIAQKTITQLTMDEVAGKHVMMFDTVPVRRVDELISTEARVV
jgi:hypothetical protein